MEGERGKKGETEGKGKESGGKKRRRGHVMGWNGEGEGEGEEEGDLSLRHEGVL